MIDKVKWQKRNLKTKSRVIIRIVPIIIRCQAGDGGLIHP